MTWKWFATIKKLIKLVGFDFEKMAYQDWKIALKCSKNAKWPKITFGGVGGVGGFGFLRWLFGGFGG